MMWYNIRIVGSADKPICEQVRNVNACHRIGDLLYFICYLPPGTWVAFSDRSYAFLCSLAAFSLICSHSDWSVLWRRYTMLPVVGRYSSSWGTIWISFPFLLQNKNFQEMETICIKYSGISPGWCGSVDWVLACESKGGLFDSWSGHMPGLWARSLVGGVWEVTDGQCISRTLMFLSPSFSLPSPL